MKIINFKTLQNGEWNVRASDILAVAKNQSETPEGKLKTPLGKAMDWVYLVVLKDFEVPMHVDLATYNAILEAMNQG